MKRIYPYPSNQESIEYLVWWSCIQGNTYHQYNFTDITQQIRSYKAELYCDIIKQFKEDYNNGKIHLPENLPKLPPDTEKAYIDGLNKSIKQFESKYQSYI